MAYSLIILSIKYAYNIHVLTYFMRKKKRRFEATFVYKLSNMEQAHGSSVDTIGAMCEYYTIMYVVIRMYFSLVSRDNKYIHYTVIKLTHMERSHRSCIHTYLYKLSGEKPHWPKRVIAVKLKKKLRPHAKSARYILHQFHCGKINWHIFDKFSKRLIKQHFYILTLIPKKILI